MQDLEQKTHTISLLVANKPGVLQRVAMVFSRRAFNIESLVVSAALDGRYSRMTITAKGDVNTLEQIIKQCNKLIDVLHASEHVPTGSIERELALFKIECAPAERTELIQICDHFKGETDDMSETTMIIQVTGSTPKIDAMVQLLGKFKILEIVRTGKVLMTRGAEET